MGTCVTQSQSRSEPVRTGMSGAMNVKDVRWWSWVGIALCLILELIGIYGARYAALAVAAISAQYYLLRYRCFYHFPTQVRVAFFSIMTLSCVPYLGFIMWFQLAGTLTFVIFGYSFVSRALLLLPTNRNFELDWHMVRNIFLTAPTEGSVRDCVPLTALQSGAMRQRPENGHVKCQPRT